MGYLLDNLYQKSCDSLDEATAKTQSLQTELSVTKEELCHTGQAKKLLDQQVEEMMENEKKFMVELEILQTALKQKEDQESTTNARLTELQDSHQKATETHTKAVELHNLAIRNLQRTLDSREQDIDLLEKDLFECREIIYSQMEKIRVYEEKEKTTEQELNTFKSENLELRGCCAALRGKEQEIRETLKYTQEELSGTREHASRLLKEQGTEMADSSAALTDLTDNMALLLNTLSNKAGIQKTPKKQIVTETCVAPDPGVAIDLSKPSEDAQKSEGSLVSMILNAAKSHDNKLENNNAAAELQNTSVKDIETQSTLAHFINDRSKVEKNLDFPNSKDESNNGDSPTTLSRKKLGFTGSSAFAPVRSGHISECVRLDTVSYSSSNTTLSGGHDVQVMRTEQISTSMKESESLPDQVAKVSDMFGEINRLVGLIEKASRSALQDMRSENDNLNGRLSQCEFTERRLSDKLKYNQQDLEKSRQLNEELREKLEEMGDRLGQYLEQEAEIKRLQQEIGHLHGKQQSLEAEKEFLNDQIRELLQRLEQSTDIPQSSGFDLHNQKEILTLQKKVHKLREQLQERQDFIEEISNKAARRIQKLEDNWKKADAEVLRFDELVDVVRNTLVTNEALIKNNEEIRKIVKLIDGEESVSSFRRSANLKPIKTSAW